MVCQFNAEPHCPLLTTIELFKKHIFPKLHNNFEEGCINLHSSLDKQGEQKKFIRTSSHVLLSGSKCLCLCRLFIIGAIKRADTGHRPGYSSPYASNYHSIHSSNRTILFEDLCAPRQRLLTASRTAQCLKSKYFTRQFFVLLPSLSLFEKENDNILIALNDFMMSSSQKC